MYDFLVALHVLSAVLLIGPFALAAFAGYRAIRRHNADDTREAARWMARFGLGSILVVILGFGALGMSDEWTFGTPWIIISITVYLITMGIATGYTVPALRKAATLVESDTLGRPGMAQSAADETGPTVTASADELATRGRLDAVAGRIAGSGAIVLLGVAIITVLMATRPFGK